MAESPFGPVIYSYSRAQAIEDGVLADVSELAKEAGFTVPVAITSALHELVNDTAAFGQSYEGRLWDVLSMLRFAIKASKGGEQLRYRVLFRTKPPKGGHEYNLNKVLKSISGPGDQGEHVITIMLDHED